MSSAFLRGKTIFEAPANKHRIHHGITEITEEYESNKIP